MTESLYDTLGGDNGVREITDELYRRLLDDPVTKPYFDGVDMDRQVRQFTTWLTGALGGPNTYTGPSLRASHASLGITDEAFDTVAAHVAAILTERDVAAGTVGDLVSAVASLRSDVVTA